MLKRFRLVIGVALLVACQPLLAQAVVEAQQVQLQAQIRRDSKGFSSCGVRVVALTSAADTMDAYDFSIMIGTDAYGTLKAGKYRAKLTPVGGKADFARDAVSPGPLSFCIAKELEGKPLLPIKVMPAETPGFILALGDGLQTLEKIVAISLGERLQFALRYKNQPGDKIVAFKGFLTNEERAPIFACIEGLMVRWRQDLGGSTNK
ncbi:hypothetical protein [Massilia sp. TWR1-2-2]|uniref:hypothetical protein n=1 Tax=Massilia sp. TWR1-2-2 TaxID=2804584 RepID=UPI003CE6AA85